MGSSFSSYDAIEPKGLEFLYERLVKCRSRINGGVFYGRPIPIINALVPLLTVHLDEFSPMSDYIFFKMSLNECTLYNRDVNLTQNKNCKTQK